MPIVTLIRDLGRLGRARLAGWDPDMVVFLLIAAGLIGLALYRFGEVRGAWTRWRASVGVLRSRRGEALRLSSGLVMVAIGAVLALLVVYGLSGHH